MTEQNAPTQGAAMPDNVMQAARKIAAALADYAVKFNTGHATGVCEGLEMAAEAGAKAVMVFRSRVNGKYYPGYHEDLRDAVKAAILALMPPETRVHETGKIEPAPNARAGTLNGMHAPLGWFISEAIQRQPMFSGPNVWSVAFQSYDGKAIVSGSGSGKSVEEAFSGALTAAKLAGLPDTEDRGS